MQRVSPKLSTHTSTSFWYSIFGVSVDIKHGILWWTWWWSRWGCSWGRTRWWITNYKSYIVGNIAIKFSWPFLMRCESWPLIQWCVHPWSSQSFHTAGVSSRSITVTNKSNGLTYTVASSLLCTSPLAVITIIGLLDVLMVSNSAESRSLFLTIYMLAPESTTGAKTFCIGIPRDCPPWETSATESYDTQPNCDTLFTRATACKYLTNKYLHGCWRTDPWLPFASDTSLPRHTSTSWSAGSEGVAAVCSGFCAQSWVSWRKLQRSPCEHWSFFFPLVTDTFSSFHADESLSTLYHCSWFNSPMPGVIVS